MTVTIKTADLIDSVADALQYISYFHPMDYIQALGAAYEPSKVLPQKTRLRKS
jgi:fumarate hydratase, class I